HRAADYYQQARLPRDDWRAIEDLAPQLAEFDLRCAAGEYDAAARVLRSIDFDYLDLWGHYHEMIRRHTRLQGKLIDPELQQISAGNLGTAYRNIGNARQAIAYYEQALAAAREQEDRWGEGVWLGNLGNAYADLGQTQRAIDFYEQALAIDREVGYRRGEGIRLGNLGNRYADLGETARAIAYYEQALAIAREIGDRAGEGRHLGNLGLAYADLGQTQRAIEFHEQALAIRREIGDRRGEGYNLTGLGNRYADLGETARAIEFYEQALAIRREIGDRCGEGIDLGNLAEVLVDVGRHAEAIARAQESVKIGEEIGSPMICNWSNGHIALANLFAGDLEQARAAAEAACEYDEPRHNAYAHALRGLIALRQGDEATARAAFTAAIAAAEALLDHTRKLYGALDDKGLALCGLALCGEPDAVEGAVAAFRQAREITSAPGVVAGIQRLVEALAVVDEAGVLASVRELM
ncbi:MAG: tetratricopeptide repeat protein, partial [Anaerolineales bacterium]